MLINPYTKRDAIHESRSFFGRTDELQQLYGMISQGQFAILIGERRVGKSSILNALQFKREEFRISDDLTFVQLDLQYFGDAEEQDFLEALLEQIARETDTKEFPPRRESLKKVSQELARQARPPRLVIVLDEVDVLAHNPRIPAKLFSSLRSWGQEFHIPFAVATREGYFERLIETQGAGSPFWNFFRTIYVGPLKRDEALELIRRPAEDLDLPFSEEEENEILTLGGYQPFFLQMACDHVFRSKSAKRVKEADRALMELEFREEATPHLNYLWDRLSDVERTAIIIFTIEALLPNAEIRRGLIRKGVLVDEGEAVRVFSTALENSIRKCDQLIRDLPLPKRRALTSFAMTETTPGQDTTYELIRRGVLQKDQHELRVSSPILLDIIRFHSDAQSPPSPSFLRRAVDRLLS